MEGEGVSLNLLLYTDLNHFLVIFQRSHTEC